MSRMPGRYAGTKSGCGLTKYRKAIQPQPESTQIHQEEDIAAKSQTLPHAKAYEARERCFQDELVTLPVKMKHEPNLEMNRLFAWSANIILLLRTAERMITPILSE